MAPTSPTPSRSTGCSLKDNRPSLKLDCCRLHKALLMHCLENPVQEGNHLQAPNRDGILIPTIMEHVDRV